MNYSIDNTPIEIPASGESSFYRSTQASVQQSFNTTSSTPLNSDYSYPPMAEQLSGRDKRQFKQLEEFDTIVVRGRNPTDGISPRSIAQSSTIKAPSPVDGRRSSRHTIGMANGGNSGRSSRSSDGRGANSASGSLRGVKTNDETNGFPTVSTNLVEGPTLNGFRNPGGMSQLSQSISQYPQATIPAVHGMMDYKMATQENTANDIPRGPQEGIMKMKTESNSTPQWSETKTKVPRLNTGLALSIN